MGAPVGLCVDHLRDADDEDLLPASSFWIATVCSPRAHTETPTLESSPRRPSPSVTRDAIAEGRPVPPSGASGPEPLRFSGPAQDLSRRARLVGAGSVLASPSLFPLGTIAWLARPALIWGGTAVLRRQTQARSTAPVGITTPARIAIMGCSKGLQSARSRVSLRCRGKDPSGSALAGGLTRPLGCGRLPAERDYQLLRSVLRYVAQSL